MRCVSLSGLVAAVWLAGGAQVLAQGHGNGLAKSTLRRVLGQPCLGVSSLAHQGLHLTASRDSEAANVARCSAGDSWSKRDWWLYQGRAETICNTTTVGSCTIFTNLSRPTRAPRPRFVNEVRI